MSFQKKDNSRYYHPIIKAITRHGMILPGEKVAVGLSGGKDSTSLFYFLDTLAKQKRLGYTFELVPICLDMGMEEVDLSPLKNFCQELGYDLLVIPTDISKIVFEVRKESSPCSLCAKLRRGFLYHKAHELGCQKVALGHHVDDAVETYFMNFLFHGKLASFEPISYLEKTQISLIRPLLYLPEKDIISFVKRENLPVIFNPCPADKKTKREEIKNLVTEISKTYPDIRQKFVKGMEQGTEADFWQKSLFLLEKNKNS